MANKQRKDIDLIINEAKENGFELLVQLDTETTGADNEDRIIENAYAIYSLNTKTGKMIFESYLEELVKAPLLIKPGAAMTHGYSNKDIRIANPNAWIDTISNIELLKLIEAKAYLVCHNTPFDRAMLAKEGVIWPETHTIDTLRVARHVYASNEDITSKSLQWLRYFFEFDENKDFDKLIKDFGIKKLQPHTALSDIVVLIYFFKFLIKTGAVKDFSEILLLTKTPLLDDIVSFGNVFDKGISISSVIGGTYATAWGQQKESISWFNWCMKNMASLSLDKKLSISKIAIEAVKSGTIKITNKELQPMIFLACPFLPEVWNILEENGINVQSQRELALTVMNSKIDKLSLSSDSKDNTEAVKLKQDLEFMLRYVDFTLNS